VFKGRIYVPEVSRRSRKFYRIYFSNYCKGISDRKLVSKDSRDGLYYASGVKAYNREIVEFSRKCLNTYFDVVCRIAKGSGNRKWVDGFILTNNGLNVFLRLYALILEHFHGAPSRKELIQLLRPPLRSYYRANASSIDDLRKRTSSEGTREDVTAAIVASLNQHDGTFASKYLLRKWKTIKQEDTYKALEQLEKTLRVFIRVSLEKVTANWWKERIPEDVRLRAEENLARKTSPFLLSAPRTELDCLDFMDYPKILTRADNWRDTFKEVFQSEESVRTHFREKNQIRVKIAHPSELTPDERQEFKSFVEKMLLAIRKSRRLRKGSRKS
jgi:hypothetical protein